MAEGPDREHREDAAKPAAPVGVRWFIAASYFPGLVRVRSYHEPDGTVIYEREVPEGHKSWLYFHEILPGDETPEAAKVSDGVRCGVFYQAGDYHVLACMYDHLPLLGYPRAYQACLDDLPTAVRERCRISGAVVYFPEPASLPDELQPIYSLLAASAPVHVDPKEVLSMLLRTPLRMYPGGGRG